MPHAACRRRLRPPHSRCEAVSILTELRDLGERFAQAQLATALPWAALARLLPDETSACANYRALLLEALDGFEDSDCNEFIDALQHRDDSQLDAALDAMAASLHSMA